MSNSIVLNDNVWMIDSRTTRVLAALLCAMTAGALLLMMMESEPPRPSRGDLAIARQTAVNLHTEISRPWQRIVVYSSTGGKDTLPGRCHFIVQPRPDAQGQWIKPTGHWKHQRPGYHLYVTGRDYNDDSVGVCLMGDFSNRSPGKEQFDALIWLVRELQRKCGISHEAVLLQRELDSGKQLPGRAFPLGPFKARLHRPNER